MATKTTMSKKGYSASFNLASIITAVFIIILLLPGGNMISDSIYKKINPSGSSFGESVFIFFFNIVCGAILFWLVYKILKLLWP